MKGLYVKEIIKVFFIVCISFIIVCCTEASKDNRRFLNLMGNSSGYGNFLKISEDLNYICYLNKSKTRNIMQYDLLIPRVYSAMHPTGNSLVQNETYTIEDFIILRDNKMVPPFYKVSFFAKVGLIFLSNYELAKTKRFLKQLLGKAKSEGNMIIYCDINCIKLYLQDSQNDVYEKFVYKYRDFVPYSTLTFILAYLFENYH